MPKPKEEALDPEQAKELEALFPPAELWRLAVEAAHRLRALLRQWAAASDEATRKEIRHAFKGVAMSYGARRVAELAREPLDAARIEVEIEAFLNACKARWKDAGDVSAGDA